MRHHQIPIVAMLSATTKCRAMPRAEYQSASVRGFLSGALRKKMGLTVTSTKIADEERRYSVKG